MVVLWPHPAQGVTFHLKDGNDNICDITFYLLTDWPTGPLSIIHSFKPSFVNSSMGLHCVHQVVN